MFGWLNTASRVPTDLASVTTIATDTEVDPRAVGVEPAAVERVWRAVERLYRTGIHPAIQLCVRCRGQVILERAIGHASGNGPDDGDEVPKVRATEKTPFNIFSASKVLTAMVVHLLDERNLLRLDDPVAEYVPEFARHGKERITIRHVLTHRAGMPRIPPEAMQLDNIANPDRLLRIFVDAEPTSVPGRLLAYHALSGGFILAEVVRRITGKSIRRFAEKEILEPLDFRWMRYGVRKRDVDRVARNYYTGPPQLPIIHLALRRALGVDPREAPALSNDPRYLRGIVPAGNVVTTANELSRFFQLLLDGGTLDGVRIFEPRTVRRATTEESYLELDMMLGVPIRYGQGFMLGGRWLSLYGPDTEHAFGHLGFSNILGWADPERQVAAALMNNGKPLFYPELLLAADIPRQIGLACPKVS